jgi:hypothetical protein
MRLLRLVVLLGAVVGLGGCASLALTAGGIAGGAGIDHTLSGIAYKTFSEPLPSVRLATLKTLNLMAMDVTKDEQPADRGEWAITAQATDRIIDIELEPVTAKATRMRVVVHKGDIFFKDAATGTEIIVQTAEALADRVQGARR